MHVAYGIPVVLNRQKLKISEKKYVGLKKCIYYGIIKYTVLLCTSAFCENLIKLRDLFRSQSILIYIIIKG